MPRKSVFYCVPRAASTALLVTQNPAAFSGNSQGQQLQRGSEVMTGENSSGKKIWLCRKFLTYVGQEEEPESKPSPWLRIGGENASGGTTGDENAKVPGEAELSVPVQRNHQCQDHRSPWKAQMLIFNLQTSEFFRESGWSEQPMIWGEVQQLKEFIPCFWWGCEGKGISSPGNWSGSKNINRGEAHKQIFTAPRGQLLCLLLTHNFCVYYSQQTRDFQKHFASVSLKREDPAFSRCPTEPTPLELIWESGLCWEPGKSSSGRAGSWTWDRIWKCTAALGIMAHLHTQELTSGINNVLL